MTYLGSVLPRYVTNEPPPKRSDVITIAEHPMVIVQFADASEPQYCGGSIEGLMEQLKVRGGHILGIEDEESVKRRLKAFVDSLFDRREPKASGRTP